MTNRSRIIDTLGVQGPLCDDCLSSVTKVKPRQQVNIACRAIEQKGLLIRSRDVCPRCGGTKILNRSKGKGGILLDDPKKKAKASEGYRKTVSEQKPTKNHDVDALSEDEIKEVVVQWLAGQGWESKVAWGRTPGIDIEATKGRQRWVIEVKGPGSRPQMRVNYFLGILGETLQRMSDPKAKYSIVLPDLPQFRGLWERLPQLAKERTNISILYVSAAGVVTHEN